MRKVQLTFAEILDDLVADKLAKEKGLTETRIAEEIGISKSVLSEYKNPKDSSKPKEPRLNTLIKIAEYFNVSLDYLAGRSQYTKDKLRYKSIESLGLSENSTSNLQEIMNSKALGKQMDKLLSSIYLPTMLRTAHRYEKACYALYFVIEADKHEMPISSMTVSDEEIQSVINVFELSRDPEIETTKHINAAFSSYGTINPAAVLKYQLTEELSCMLSDVAQTVQKQVEGIVDKELSGD